MSVNDILDGLIASATADKNTLDALILQLQHTTITSSDEELYDAPTLDEETGIWTLAQTTANVDGMYVGCYKLPVTSINSYIRSITVVSFSNPASPAAPASVTVSGGSPDDLTDITDLEGQAFNSFCIRSATAFEITLRIRAEDFEVWVWDELAADAIQIFPDEDGLYTANSGVTMSGTYYICSIMFGNLGPQHGDNTKCQIITDVVSHGEEVGPLKYRCGDGALDALATCVVQYTYGSHLAPFTIDFKVADC